ncbi:WXG100 family type VII secretion target [Saccharothrix australiensis]|uniref:Uncharacterized protein n=1 Tax=Saccharothrix australiensis TaxID=2072 RepID=A0A495W1I1_9PSEU|nr:hypothetical protein [Saccharothrix australiensis]RKT55486.1 hypothetical protein C8E97_4155 [Saccharothrix australiensis]
MTAYLTAKAAVGGDPAQLTAMADVLATAAEDVDGLATALRRAADDTDQSWQGKAATAYRTRTATHVGSLAKLTTPLNRAATAYRALAGELEGAQRKADKAMQDSVALGMGEGDLVGRPFQVAKFALLHPQHVVTIGHLIGDVVDARAMADAARDRFVTSADGVRADVAALRDPDGAGGQRQRNDRLWRRPEGGDSRDLGRGVDLSSDWAGRAILDRYLRGGGDWTIVDDADWSKYMMGNEQLRTQLSSVSEAQAQQALRDHLAGKHPPGAVDRTFHAEIQNGEGIVGYQYLHGTDSKKGDFRYQGESSVRELPDGTYEVTTKAGYTWNDTIDPNPQYSTDKWKSKLAEVLTLGQADPYDLHITWHAENRTVLDKDGRVIRAQGYPGS